MKKFLPDELVLVRMWNPPMWSLRRYSHCMAMRPDGYIHVTQDNNVWKDEDILHANGNIHLLGTGDDYTDPSHGAFETDVNFQDVDKAERAKKVKQLEAERNILAEWAANYFDCPMTDGHVCEHQKIPGRCSAKNVHPECWLKAAKFELSMRAEKKDKETNR